MNDKPKIKRGGFFWGAAEDRGERGFRSSVIEQQLKNHDATRDHECLAQIAEHADYFGHMEAGKLIAYALRDRNRRKNGVEAAIEWDWMMTVYDNLKQEQDWREAPQEAIRLRVAEIFQIPESEREKWCERLRKQLAKRAKGN